MKTFKEYINEMAIITDDKKNVDEAIILETLSEKKELVNEKTLIPKELKLSEEEK